MNLPALAFEVKANLATLHSDMLVLQSCEPKGIVFSRIVVVADSDATGFEQPDYRRYDLLLTANGSPAPRLDTHDPPAFWKRPNFTSPFNCTGGPALALLCGFSKNGLPLSLQIAGRPHEDSLVLRAGHAYETATGFFKHMPDLRPGAASAALDPKPWRPDTSQVEPAVRVLAENAAIRSGLRLTPEQVEELTAVAPWALAMAKRLRRDHPRSAEVSSIFDPTR